MLKILILFSEIYSLAKYRTLSHKETPMSYMKT